MSCRIRDNCMLLLFFVLMGMSLSTLGLHAQEEKKPPKVTYEDHVKPLLRQKCFSCHDPDKKKGDLDMTSYTNLMQGGGSGAVIEPGDSASSYLYTLITHESEPFMPPDSPKLPDEMIETIRKWIDGGVLENAGSKASVSTKKKFDFALKAAPTDRPAVPPVPGRLSQEPITRTSSAAAVSALASSPWSPLVAVAGQKQVLLYNTQTSQLLGALPFPEGVPRVLKFSRNGQLLLAGGGRGGANGRVVVWNVTNGERAFEVGDELDTVLAADISSDHSLVALGGPQRVVRIYSTETGQLLHELRKHTDWIYCLEFSPDSVLLASGDRNGGLLVWEGWTGREFLTLAGHSAAVTGLSWRGDSNVLATSSEDSTIRLWEMDNGGQIKSWGAHGGGVACVELARDGRILSCGRDRVAKLWDQNGGQIRAFEPFGDLALQVTFCDETNRVIAGDWTGAIRVWNAADGAVAGQLSSNPPRLAERLDEAAKLLAAKQAEHKPLAEAYQAAQAAADKAKADLAAAQNAAADAQKRSESLATEVNARKEATVKATADHEAAELDKARQQLAAAEKAAQETASALPAAQQQVEKLTPLVKPAEEQAAAAKGAADAAAAAVASAQKDVDRWNDEIAFTNRLRQLTEQRTAAAGQMQQRQAEHAQLLADAQAAQAAADKAKADLAAAENAVAAAQKQSEAGTTAVNTAKGSLAQVSSAHESAAKTVGVIENALAPLNDQLVKAEDAAKKSAGDTALAEAAAKLKSLVDAKKVELEAARKDLTEKTQAVEAAKQQVAAADKAGAEAMAALQAARAAADNIAAAAKATAEKAAAANKAADAAAQTVAAAQKELDRVNDEIAAAQGLKHA